MIIDEVEVYVTPNGLGRASIVRRADGLFCVYVHIRLPQGYLPQHFDTSNSHSWIDDTTPLADLYKDKRPASGILGTIDDARRYIRNMSQFADAHLKKVRQS